MWQMKISSQLWERAGAYWSKCGGKRIQVSHFSFTSKVSNCQELDWVPSEVQRNENAIKYAFLRLAYQAINKQSFTFILN